MSENPQNTVEHQHPNIFRRLAAMLYDALLLLAIIMICFIPVPLLPESFRVSAAGKLLLQAYIALILYIFFGWFWTHHGQTLGMRAWRIKAVSHNSGCMTWFSAGKRFVLAAISFAALGSGYLLCLFHPQNMTFHDLFSGTKLVMTRKNNRKSGNTPQQKNADKQKHDNG